MHWLSIEKIQLGYGVVCFYLTPVTQFRITCCFCAFTYWSMVNDLCHVYITYCSIKLCGTYLWLKLFYTTIIASVGYPVSCFRKYTKSNLVKRVAWHSMYRGSPLYYWYCYLIAVFIYKISTENFIKKSKYFCNRHAEDVTASTWLAASCSIRQLTCVIGTIVTCHSYLLAVESEMYTNFSSLSI